MDEREKNEIEDRLKKKVKKLFNEATNKEVILLPDKNQPNKKYLVDLGNFQKAILDFIVGSYEEKKQFDKLPEVRCQLYCIADEKKYDEEYVANLENIDKTIRRIEARVIKGRKPEPSKVSSDNTCYEFLDKLQKKSKLEIKFLEKIKDENLMDLENNKYIAKMMLEIIDCLQDSCVFNYIPKTNNYQKESYVNRLNVLKEDILRIYAENDEIKKTWLEIVKPLENMILKSDYPGIEEKSIWVKKNEKLKYFDAVYEVAKSDTDLYKKIQNGNNLQFNFDLGDTEDKIQKQLDRYKHFFENQKSVEENFYSELSETFRKIVGELFGVCV